MVFAARRLYIIFYLSGFLYCSHSFGMKTLSEEIRAEEANGGAPSKASPFKTNTIKQPLSRYQPSQSKNKKLETSPVKFSKTGGVIPNKSHPTVARLYDDLESKIRHERLNKDNKNSMIDKNGIDIALKELAAEFEKQILTLLWQFASSGVTSGNGFRNDVWSSELTKSIIEAGYDENNLGEIGLSVYDELKYTLDEENKEI